jgi:hypothetical protein
VSDLKAQPNHEMLIKIVRGMTEEQRLSKAFELSDMTRALFEQGLRERFSNLSEREFKDLLFQRLELCHNRNW